MTFLCDIPSKSTKIKLPLPVRKLECRPDLRIAEAKTERGLRPYLLCANALFLRSDERVSRSGMGALCQCSWLLLSTKARQWMPKTLL